MPKGIIIGAVAGLVVGWLIAVARSRFTYLGGVSGRFEGLGCAANIVLYIVCAAVGTVIGALLFGR